MSVLASVIVASWIVGATAQGPTGLFTDVSASCGITARMTCGATPSQHILEVNGGGVALFDFDRDGDLDVFLANGATLEDPQAGPGSRLYLNRGDGRFDDHTAAVGLTVRRWAMGIAIGDYDGDGFEDVFLACYGPNVLLRNLAGRRFEDVSMAAGLADDRWATSAAFADLDGDRDLDLYVVNYLQFDHRMPPNREGKFFKGVPVMAGPSGLEPQHDVLYRNVGGRYEDASLASGCRAERPGYGLGVVIFDVEGDGRSDIFVGNDSTENRLYRNLGDFKFKNVGTISGVGSNYDGSNQATMGIGLGDVDGNGFADLFTTNFSSDTNTLHLNLGDGFFDDRTSQFGLAQVSRPFLSWGTGFYDFDGDSDEDLFIASGHVYPEAATLSMDSEYAQRPLLFERVGRRFRRSTNAGEAFAKRFVGRATAFGDLDGDGDVDILMTTLNGPVLVLRNDAIINQPIVVEVDAGRGNPTGLGSRVELETTAGVQRRWIHGGSYQSCNAPAAYFAVPAAARITALRVTWPASTEPPTSYGGITPRTRVRVERDAAKPVVAPLRMNPAAQPPR
jgi:hypothetical protein